MSYPANCFSNDPVIDRVIKNKLTEKFSSIGVLGNSPPKAIPDSYLFELYEIFQSRLFADGAGSEEYLDAADQIETYLSVIQDNKSISPTGPGGGLHGEIWGYPQSNTLPAKTAPRSVFENRNHGEFTFYNLATSEKLKILENLPLNALFAWTKKNKEHKYFYSPFLMCDKSYIYLFRLPIYWCPLWTGKDLQLIEEGFGLDPAFEDGLSVLRLKLQKNAAELNSLPRKKRFFNFVSNTEIPSSAGVFYYEVMIEQTASLSTQFRPIIYTNDSSLSSGSSLLFNMGFIKRFVKFDKIPSATSSLSASSLSIDIRSLLHKLSQNSSATKDNKIDEETLTFLGAEPGVSLEGSLAISFNNSCSYASMKTGDNTYRSSSLNLNRRISQLNRHNQNDQETSKLDIDAPFNIHYKSGAGGKKLFKSDVVGFGVNFISKTLFITLNGILVKSISDEEITASNKYKDSIFDSREETASLFPIIGFQLSDILGNIQDGEPPESKITTNFGLKPFLFNIDGYVKLLKDEQRVILLSSVSDEINNIIIGDAASENRNGKNFEESVCNINNNSDLLNDLIKGYLVQEVYMDSYKALQDDLLELESNTSVSVSRENADLASIDEKSSIVDLSFAKERQRLKQLILDHDFIQAMEYMDQNFRSFPEKQNFQFELQLSNLIKLLKIDLQRDSFDHGIIDEDVIKYSKQLLNQTQSDNRLTSLVGELTGVLLLKNRDELRDLPEAKTLIDNFEPDTELLADHINIAISKLLGLQEESRLQAMVNKVGENIHKLSQIEEPFKLVNYERDFIEP